MVSSKRQWRRSGSNARRDFSLRRGFTLLEVLIALAILAISSIAVISQTGQSLRQLNQLELKTMALWLAENQINTYRLSEQWPATGRQSSALTAAGQSWLVSTTISATSDPHLRKIEVSVALDKQTQPVALVNLIAYRGKH